jgi:hypothetical protein
MLVSSAFALNQYKHPETDTTVKVKQALAWWPWSCEVTIQNRSRIGLNVYAIYQDGAEIAFDMMPYERSVSISLRYYGYCHDRLYLNISDFYGYPLFAGYPIPGDVVKV